MKLIRLSLTVFIVLIILQVSYSGSETKKEEGKKKPIYPHCFSRYTDLFEGRLCLAKF